MTLLQNLQAVTVVLNVVPILLAGLIVLGVAIVGR
jgi:hypothetical protein